MAIAFDCPHCQLPYRLKDEFAGKQAKCKNPDCRKVITIPAPKPAAQPVAAEQLRPAPTQAELDAAALAALSDEPPKQEEVPPEEKVIPMTCEYCEHKWTEPWSKAGKNTLCPNPECRRRLKVPEPKEDVPEDWRQQKTKLPSLAKQNFEKPTDVQDAGDVKIVSGAALKEADATGEEIEPRPLKDKILIVMAVVGLLAGVTFGVRYLFKRGAVKGEEQLMVEAVKEFKDVSKDLQPGEGGPCAALLHTAYAEYTIRHEPLDLKRAREEFDLARKELRALPPGPSRSAAAGEIALAVLALGGTEQEVKEQTRYPWLPDTTSGRPLRMNEKVHTVHEEVRQSLELLRGQAEFEFRLPLARRLTRALVQKGQAGFAADIVPKALFTDPEQDEARAVVALEIYRSDRGSDVPRQVADVLKVQLFLPTGSKGVPFPASAQTLFTAVGIDKPVFVPPPPAGGQVAESARIAHVGSLLLQDKADEALKLALRPGSPGGSREGQMRALVLCAEWAADPGPAVDAALALYGSAKAGKTDQPSPYHALRLAQIAAAAGKVELATKLVATLADDALKAWAAGDVVRFRLAANPKEAADENWAEIPDDVKKQRAGHAWGRLWVARRTAALSKDQNREKKATAAWPGAAKAFALAGIALGMQDK